MTDKTSVRAALNYVEHEMPGTGKLLREYIETLQQQLDAAKQENERLRQIRYNATEAHLNIQTGLVEQIETLQQRLKQVEEAIQVAYNIAYENFETVNQMDLIRLTLGDTLSIIRGEANKEENA